MRRMFFAKLFLTFMLSFSVSPAFSFMEVRDTMAIMKLANQLTQLETQASYLKQQLDMLKTLEPSKYQKSDVTEKLDKLKNIMQNTQGLAYEVNTINNQFKSLYPGYSPPTDYGKIYQQIIDNTQNTLKGSMLSIAESNSNFNAETQRLNTMQTSVQNAVGPTQAIQGASQIAAEQVTQIQLLRQTVMAQATAQNAYYAAQIQKEASARAEMDKVINAGTTTSPEIGNSGKSIESPNFKE